MPKTFGTPGPRLILPTICTSVPLASCPVEAQLLFERLITQADDQGRLQGEPRVVAALCLPLVKAATDRAVGKWLVLLAQAGLIIRYVSDGRELLQIAGWWDNQGNPRRAYPSRYPAPEGWTDRVRVDGVPPQPADNPPRIAPETPQFAPDSPRSADNPPLAGANPSRPSPSFTQPDAEGARADDPVVALYDRTARFPGDKLRQWVTDLGERHGDGRVTALIRATPMDGGNVKAYLERITDTLRAEDHAAEAREAAVEAAKVLAQRATPAPMSPAIAQLRAALLAKEQEGSVA